MEENANTDQPLGDVENITQRYDHNSVFVSNSHISLHHHEIAAISREYDGIVESSNVGTQVFGVKDELFVVDSCHKQSDFVYQTLEDVNRTQVLCDEWVQRDKKEKL